MISPPTNWIRLTGALTSETFAFSSHDWKMLHHLSGPEAREWLASFGFFAAGSVSAGREIDHRIAGDRNRMMTVTEGLIERLATEVDLLRYDYWVQKTPGRNGEPYINYFGGSVGGLSYRGKWFGLRLGPGQCLLTESVADDPVVIDIRREKHFSLDGDVMLKIGRRQKGIAWTGVLPLIVDFLRSESSPEINIHNHHM